LYNGSPARLAGEFFIDYLFPDIEYLFIEHFIQGRNR